MTGSTHNNEQNQRCLINVPGKTLIYFPTYHFLLHQFELQSTKFAMHVTYHCNYKTSVYPGTFCDVYRLQSRHCWGMKDSGATFAIFTYRTSTPLYYRKKWSLTFEHWRPQTNIFCLAPFNIFRKMGGGGGGGRGQLFGVCALIRTNRYNRFVCIQNVIILY